MADFSTRTEESDLGGLVYIEVQEGTARLK